MRSVVRLVGASVEYSGTRALTDLDLEVSPGERVAIVGPSGAGKSTLLGLCNGTVQPTSGSVEVLGRDLGRVSDRELRNIRSKIGTVHQRLHLVEQLRVVHNVNAGRLGTWSATRALRSLIRPHGSESVREALARMGVDHKMNERTDRLSGGEQQRVALARILVQEPELVLADEPVSSLDPERAREVMGLLAGLVADGPALIVSLHAFDLAREFCDRVIGMRSGSVLFDLEAHQVTDGLGAQLYRTSGP